MQSATVRQKMARLIATTLGVGVLLVSVGCAATYGELRIQGQQSMLEGAYGPARSFFIQADEKKPRRVENLHDLGACSVMLARAKFEQMNQPAALRELDRALAYYGQAIDVYPGHQAALEGKSITLKLKGQIEAAVANAEWAAKFVGPSAKQYIFLAKELDGKGDSDGAFLRFRQAVAVQPDNPEAHRAFAVFLIDNNNDDAATFHLQQAYRLDPENQWVMDELISRHALPPLAPDGNDPS